MRRSGEAGNGSHPGTWVPSEGGSLSKNSLREDEVLTIACLYSLQASGASPGSLVPASLPTVNAGIHRTSSPRKATGMTISSTAIWLSFGIAASLILFLY